MKKYESKNVYFIGLLFTICFSRAVAYAHPMKLTEVELIQATYVGGLEKNIIKLLAQPGALSALKEDSPLLDRNLYTQLAHFVPQLLAKGANPNVTDQYTSALLQAISGHNSVAVALLLQAGANPNDAVKLTCFEEIPLLSAIKEGQIEVVRYLLQYGARPNVVSHIRTPLIVAIGDDLSFARLHSNRTSIVKLLLQHGADPLTYNSRKDTSLSIMKRNFFNSGFTGYPAAAYRAEYKRIARALIRYNETRCTLCGKYNENGDTLPQEIVSYIMQFVDVGL